MNSVTQQKAQDQLSAIERKIGEYLKDYAGTFEGDDSINDLSRAEIKAYAKINGECWLGSVNLHEGSSHWKPECRELLWKWNGGIVYNFGATFAIPKYDATLTGMILSRHNTPYIDTPTDAAYVDAIFDRIDELGGITLIWS